MIGGVVGLLPAEGAAKAIAVLVHAYVATIKGVAELSVIQLASFRCGNRALVSDYDYACQATAPSCSDTGSTAL